MAYTDIDKPSDYFNTKLWTGDASSNRAITGVGFQPDWLWIKDRDASEDHCLFDSVRGADKRLFSNSTSAESTLNSSNRLVSFDTDGFTIGLDGNVNGSGDKYVGWSWLASNTTASNTDGSITSTVSANTTSGFSIVGWTGTNANATVGHGLGSAPKMIIIRRRESASTWVVYHASTGNTGRLALDETSAFNVNSTFFNNTSPTSTTFSVGTDGGSNGSTDNYIAYCFAEKKGFSKAFSYTGNGSTNGTFTYLGFRPAFVLIKQSSASGQNWFLTDNKRNDYNAVDKLLYADSSNAEVTSGSHPIDFLSNGFKCRGTGSGNNGSGATYIGIAFAENPFVTSGGIPTTAR